MQAYDEIIAHIPKQMKYDDTIDRIHLLNTILEALNQPQAHYEVMHICGTNGKGSTGTLISQFLRSHDQTLKVGRFISPAMYDDLDQITINNQAITQAQFVACYKTLQTAFNQVGVQQAEISLFESFFLISTIYFKSQNIDYALYECGLGGELDATNALQQSAFTVFTKIDLDHMQILGATIAQIAQTKSKIIDENSVVIDYPNQTPTVTNILKQEAKLKNASFYDDSPYQVQLEQATLTSSNLTLTLSSRTYTNIVFNMAGRYQINNLQNALNWLFYFNQSHASNPITDAEIVSAITSVHIEGRMEVVHQNPLMIIDGAHNVNGIQALVNSLDSKQHYTIIIGFLKDKDYADCIDCLKALNADFIITEPFENERFLDKDQLSQTFIKHGIQHVYTAPNLEAALQAVKSSNDPVIITGSFYLINHVKPALKKGILS